MLASFSFSFGEVDDFEEAVRAVLGVQADMRAPPSPPAWSKNRPVSSSLSPIREASHDEARLKHQGHVNFVKSHASSVEELLERIALKQEDSLPILHHAHASLISMQRSVISSISPILDPVPGHVHRVRLATVADVLSSMVLEPPSHKDIGHAVAADPHPYGVRRDRPLSGWRGVWSVDNTR